MPNSRVMRQMLEFDLSVYHEGVDDGKPVMEPVIICVQRGMVIYSDRTK
jgi:hypothetical protein